MIIDLTRKRKHRGLVVVLLLCTALIAVLLLRPAAMAMMAGGQLRYAVHALANADPAASPEAALQDERFTRPSQSPLLPNPYAFKDFFKQDGRPPLVTTRFDQPEQAVLAYYGILQEASNLLGFSGGCGSVGWGTTPYPYAHELLTPESRKALPLKRFIDSFAGIGRLTLLKLIPLAPLPGAPATVATFMVELEAITGLPTNGDEAHGQGSRFAYYYGLVTAEQTPTEGWKLTNLHYLAEDFLCAPAHGWFYLADAVVHIVYGDNLKLITSLDRTEQQGDQLFLYATGPAGQYRFDFVRLTNGYDILLQENLLAGDTWTPTNLLPKDWAYLKLSADAAQ